jgi:hypothetical protein
MRYLHRKQSDVNTNMPDNTSINAIEKAGHHYQYLKDWNNHFGIHVNDDTSILK